MKRMARRPSGQAALGDEGIALVDSAFKPTALDSGLDALLADVNAQGGEGDVVRDLPRDLLDALKARPLLELDAAPIIVTISGRSYSCRCFLLKPQTRDAAEPVLALYLKREISIVDSVRQVGSEYSLTDREQEVLLGVAMGLTSKELAVRMHISPNTVKAFLRLVMGKMGASTRAGIVGRLLDPERSASMAASKEFEREW